MRRVSRQRQLNRRPNRLSSRSPDSCAPGCRNRPRFLLPCGLRAEVPGSQRVLLRPAVNRRLHRQGGDNPNLNGPVTRYMVDLMIPAHSLLWEPAPEGHRRVNLESALVVYNREGKAVNWILRQVNLNPGRRALHRCAGHWGQPLSRDRCPRHGGCVARRRLRPQCRPCRNVGNTAESRRQFPHRPPVPNSSFSIRKGAHSCPNLDPKIATAARLLNCWRPLPSLPPLALVVLLRRWRPPREDQLPPMCIPVWGCGHSLMREARGPI